LTLPPSHPRARALTRPRHDRYDFLHRTIYAYKDYICRDPAAKGYFLNADCSDVKVAIGETFTNPDYAR